MSTTQTTLFPRSYRFTSLTKTSSVLTSKTVSKSLGYPICTGIFRTSQVSSPNHFLIDVYFLNNRETGILDILTWLFRFDLCPHKPYEASVLCIYNNLDLPNTKPLYDYRDSDYNLISLMSLSCCDHSL